MSRFPVRGNSSTWFCRRRPKSHEFMAVRLSRTSLIDCRSATSPHSLPRLTGRPLGYGNFPSSREPSLSLGNVSLAWGISYSSGKSFRSLGKLPLVWEFFRLSRKSFARLGKLSFVWGIFPSFKKSFPRLTGLGKRGGTARGDGRGDNIDGFHAFADADGFGWRVADFFRVRTFSRRGFGPM
jgi:hypothetical protein